MPDDARLLELEWLTELEQKGEKAVPSFQNLNTPRCRLYLYLLAKGLAEDRSAGIIGTNDPTAYRSQREKAHWMAVRNASLGHGTTLAITHAGAVRRADLEQQLKSGRIKETMGLVWDGRHFQQDARIALLDAAPERPLVVSYLDLNDVKRFNEKSHAAGDDAIRRYLEVIAELTFDRGDAYRLSGGADEVVILLPRLALEAAVGFTRTLLAALGREVVHALTLRAAAGVVVATDPAEAVDALKKRADAEQLRAKTASHAGEGRPSVLAWPGAEPEPIATRGTT